MSVITAYVPLGRALVRPEVSVYVVWSVRLRTDTGTDSGLPLRPRVTTVSWFEAADAAPGSSATDAMSPAAVTPASTRRRRVRSPVITCSPRVCARLGHPPGVGDSQADEGARPQAFLCDPRPHQDWRLAPELLVMRPPVWWPKTDCTATRPGPTSRSQTI